VATDDVIVRLRLRDAKKFQKDAEKSGKAIGSIDEGAKKSNKRMAVMAGGLKKVGPPMLLAGAAAVGFGVKSVQAFNESRKVAKQTGAVLKSTGGAAGVTSKQIEDLSGSIATKTGIDDDAIQSGQNLLLTFTNVRNESGKGNDVFNQTTKTMTDMSAALGQDTKTSAIQLGKALNDPVKGVGALSKVGVSFTKDQKKQIEGLVKHGKTLDAQKVILKELNKEFGGSAEAQASATGKLSNTFGELQENIGGKLVPAVDTVAGGLNNFIGGMENGTGAGGKFATIVKSTVGGALRFIQKFLKDNRGEIDKLGQAFKNIAIAVKWVFMNVVLPVMKSVWPSIKKIIGGALKTIGGIIKLFSAIFRGDFGDMWKAVKQIFRGALDVLVGYLGAVTAPFRLAWQKIGDVIAGGATAAWEGVKSIVISGLNWVIDRINDLIGAYNKLPLAPDIGKIGHIAAPGTSGDRPKQKNLGMTGHLQSGGLVPGHMRGDVFSARLEPGEFVVKRPAVEALGPSFMQSINQGVVPAGGAGGKDIVIKNQMVVDGRVLAESVSRHTANKRARR
jgi:acid phosphatase family membrane protein YuiD